MESSSGISISILNNPKGVENSNEEIQLNINNNDFIPNHKSSEVMDHHCQINDKLVSDSNLNHLDVQITNENVIQDQDATDSRKDPSICLELPLNSSDLEIEDSNIKPEPELEILPSTYHNEVEENDCSLSKNSSCLKEINFVAGLVQNQHQLETTDEPNKRSANYIIQLLGRSSLNTQTKMDMRKGGKSFIHSCLKIKNCMHVKLISQLWPIICMLMHILNFIRYTYSYKKIRND